MLSYRKLYADIVAEDGTVCIVYATWLDLVGWRQHAAGYELYPPSGTRTVVRATAPARVDADRADGVRLQFATPAGAFAFTCRPGTAAPALDHHPASGLRWSVVVAAGDAEARGITGFDRGMRGRGYADWVAFARPPRRLGIGRVQWGRAHAGGRSLVFNRVIMRSGHEWQTSWDGQRWSAELELIEKDGRLAEVRAGTNVVAIDAGRILHEGAALDRDRMPVRAERTLARALAGPIREVRRLSAADLAGVAGVALHEDVRFGEP